MTRIVAVMMTMMMTMRMRRAMMRMMTTMMTRMMMAMGMIARRIVVVCYFCACRTSTYSRILDASV